jgi:hypothetical protein
MKSNRIVGGVIAVSLMGSLVIGAGVAEARDKKARDIALGVGLGLLAGAAASQGDARGAIGGAVAGGLIGAAVSRDQDRRNRTEMRRDWRFHDDRGRYRQGRGYPPRY